MKSRINEVHLTGVAFAILAIVATIDLRNALVEQITWQVFLSNICTYFALAWMVSSAISAVYWPKGGKLAALLFALASVAFTIFGMFIRAA